LCRRLLPTLRHVLFSFIFIIYAAVSLNNLHPKKGWMMDVVDDIMDGEGRRIIKNGDDESEIYQFFSFSFHLLAKCFQLYLKQLEKLLMKANFHRNLIKAKTMTKEKTRKQHKNINSLLCRSTRRTLTGRKKSMRKNIAFANIKVIELLFALAFEVM
jgi:hypothetical protein